MATGSNSKGGPRFPVLPCACANLRRAARAVTRSYNRELSKIGLEVTQYTLLMALEIRGSAISQGDLGKLLALDTTTLTRMLLPLQKHGWIASHSGSDRRQRLLTLTAAGRAKLRRATPYWERAQQRFRERVGDDKWNQLGAVLAMVTEAASGM